MPEIEVLLDNPEILAEIDKDGMAAVLGDFAAQCRQAQEIGQAFKVGNLPAKPLHIVIQGMGGSGMSGQLLQKYLEEVCPVPIYLSNDYSLPAWVNAETLFVAVSYSGNTEETLSCLEVAVARGCALLGVTSGGALKERFTALKAPLLLIPGGLLPRAALGYLFIPLLIALSRLGLCSDQTAALTETIDLLEKLRREYQPATSEVSNQAKKIAYHLHEKIPLIYACQRHFGVVAWRWKGQINENAKQLAFCNVLPEMNHNELVGWGENQEMNWQFGVVFLKDSDDSPRNQIRQKLSQQVIGPKAGDMLEVKSQGVSLLARLFSLIYLGDYASYYLAILNTVNPSPIKIIDFIKSRLQKEG